MAYKRYHNFVAWKLRGKKIRFTFNKSIKMNLASLGEMRDWLACSVIENDFLPSQDLEIEKT